MLAQNSRTAWRGSVSARAVSYGRRNSPAAAFQLAPAGWIGLACVDEEMAIWLMRAIVVENVMVRRERAVLYLPAGPRFTLEGEIKNVVTAVAKTHHYWIQHQTARD